MKGCERGRWGEDEACRYLRALGWRVLARNWRGRAGELDLVCRDGDTLVFVEVKARTSRRFGAPEEAVDDRKLARLERAANEYLAREVVARGQPEPACRIDVVAIERGPDGRVETRLISGVELS